MRNLLKNYSRGILITLLPRYLALNFCEMFYLLVTGKLDVLWKAYIKAYIWNACNLGDTLKERRKVQHMRKISDCIIQKNMLKHNAKLDTFLRIGAPKFK